MVPQWNPRPGRLGGRRQRCAHHHRVRSAHDRLGDVTAGGHAAVGDDVDVHACLVEVTHASGTRVGDGRGHGDADAQHPARRPGRTGTSADQHACRAGAHEVEGRLVRRAPADHHGDLVVTDEVLQVQGLAVARHVLRRHDRALDHEQIRFGTQDVRGQPEGARGGAGDGHRVALCLELPDALLDEIGLHRLGVELLHPAGRLVDGQRGDLLEDRIRLGVASPEPLEVQHAQPSEATQLGGHGRRHDAVGRRRHHRELEAEGVDLPRDVDLFRVARPATRHDGDVVEAVGTASGLADADLDVSHGGGVPPSRLGKGTA